MNITFVRRMCFLAMGPPMLFRNLLGRCLRMGMYWDLIDRFIPVLDVMWVGLGLRLRIMIYIVVGLLKGSKGRWRMAVKDILLIRLIIPLGLCSKKIKFKKFVNGHKIILISILYLTNFMLIQFMDK